MANNLDVLPGALGLLILRTLQWGSQWQLAAEDSKWKLFGETVARVLRPRE